ncbi:MAG: M55 family metallopeptidase [Thermomicrobiales bacterium]|nr:M55 family metallopeptidase [Thermomicrobiales bacterium]MCO5221300.1 M55 family metallopeptidase [Thermomicrobiales bacterium]
MRIHICADMEGTCGVYSWMQVTPPETPWSPPIKESEYDRCRLRMTHEVSAAARGALSAGATEILVNDFHGGNRNIFIDELDERCRLVSGGAGPMNFLQGMTPETKGLFYTGFHSKAGTVSSALAHTWSTNLNDLRIAGESTGEFGLIAYCAGALGVPVLLVTGDQTACDQTEAFLKRPVVKAVVKEGISQTGAISMHPKRAQRLIEENAAQAMKLIGNVEPAVLPENARVELDYDHQSRAEAAERQGGAERIGERTVAFTAADGIDLLHKFVNTMRASAIPLSP